MQNSFAIVEVPREAGFSALALLISEPVDSNPWRMEKFAISIGRFFYSKMFKIHVADFLLIGV